jgi:hypothetical protein
MGEQEVDFLDQRLDFERQRLVHARGAAFAHRGNGTAHAAQGAKAIIGLEPGHDEQAHAQHQERPDQNRADTGDLRVELAPAGRNGELPQRVAARQDHRAFDHAQPLVIAKLVGIVDVRRGVDVIGLQLERAVPQRARGKSSCPCPEICQ